MNQKTKHVLWLTFALLLATVLFWPSPAQASTPVQPNYGSATVDGNAGEWDLTLDYFADMYRAGNPNKELESQLYLRYDTINQIVYVLVLSVNGQNILQTPTDGAYVFVDGSKVVDGGTGDDGTAPDFAWVNPDGSGRAEGWEASFPLAIPLESDPDFSINVHCNVYSDGSSQTSAVAGRSITFQILPYDYGDMIAEYGVTLLENGGPRHLAGPMRLGLRVDGEIDGQCDDCVVPIGDDQDSNNGDDEDGVLALGNWPTQGPKIEVTVSNCDGTCYLNGWLDWNNDGSFLESSDQIFFDMPITNGTHAIDLTNPGVSLAANFFTRFRLCQAENLCNTVTDDYTALLQQGIMAPTAEIMGEVEDYYWEFAPTPVRLQSFSVSSDAGMSPLYLGGSLLLGLVALVVIRKRF